METIHNTASLRRTILPTAQKLLVLPGYPVRQTIELSDVVYIEGAGNYVIFNLNDKPKLVVAYTLASYESLPGFVRIHKRHVVNVAYIANLTVRSRIEAWVHLTNGIRLPISRRRIDQVVANLNGEQVVS